MTPSRDKKVLTISFLISRVLSSSVAAVVSTATVDVRLGYKTSTLLSSPIYPTAERTSENPHVRAGLLTASRVITA